MTRRLVVVIAALAFTTLAACDSAGGPRLAQSAATQLGTEVATIRQLALNGDRGSVESQLAQLRTDVRTLQSGGQLSARAAVEVLAAADHVQSLLDRIVTPTTTTTTTTTAPPKHKGKGGGDG